MKRILIAVALLVVAAHASADEAGFASPSYAFTVSQQKIIRINRTFYGGFSSPTLYIARNSEYASRYYNLSFSGTYVDIDISNAFPWSLAEYVAPQSTYRLTIDSGYGASQRATLVVVPDGPPPILSIDDVTIDEGNSGPGNGFNRTVAFAVNLSTPIVSPIVLTPIVHDGTATRNVDYSVSGDPIVFNPGEVQKQIVATILGDLEPEGDEWFSIELPTPPPGVTLLKGIGTCTIRDDDGAVGPAKLSMPRGTNSAIEIHLGSPAPSPEQITLLSHDPSVASVPSIATLQTGASSLNVPVTSGSAGATAISVTLPQSRGGRTFDVQAFVYEPAVLSFDRIGVLLEPGGVTNVIARLDPAPASPVTIALSSSNPTVVSIQSSITIGIDGNATIPIHAITIGFSSITATLPDVNGGVATGFRVDVAIPTGTSITSLGKSSGRASGGEAIAIAGNNFIGRCIVTFGGIPSPSAQTTNATTISAISPSHDAGAVDVAVKCGTSQSVLRNGFTYTASPLHVRQVNPPSGTSSGGTLVRISGDNLRAGACVVFFGNTVAKSVSANQTFDMTVAAPPHASGAVDVALRCGGDSYAVSGAYSYIDSNDSAAIITSTNVATAAPGDRVTLSGARFRVDDIVFVAGVAALDVTGDQNDTRVLTIPEIATGTAAITLRDALGRTVAGPSITIISPRAVTIGSLSTPAAAGSEITIKGSGFRRALHWSIGSLAVSPITLTLTEAVLRVPPALTNGNQEVAISDDSTKLATAIVDVTSNGLSADAVAPPCSAADGGSLATITGHGFTDGAVVQFGGVYSVDSVVRDATSLIAKIPPSFGATRVPITITNAGGKSTTLTGTFEYKTPGDGCGGARRRPSTH